MNKPFPNKVLAAKKNLAEENRDRSSPYRYRAHKDMDYSTDEEGSGYLGF
jgi:hypothetical protein